MASITLLSDFGTKDATAAIARGILMQYNPHIQIYDITHDVTPYNIIQAAYFLKSAYSYYPKGTVHIVMCGMFVNREPSLTLTICNGHYFICTNNGLLPLALQNQPLKSWIYPNLDKTDTFNSWLKTTGKLINKLPLTGTDNSGLKEIVLLGNNNPGAIPDTNPTNIEVIHVDQFENVVLNINQEQFYQITYGMPFKLQFKKVEEIREINTNYSDVREGFKLARFNSNGYLEIGINKGKAASLFGLKLGSKTNEIKIILE